MMAICDSIIIKTTKNNKRSIAKHARVRMSKTQLSLARVSIFSNLDLQLTYKLFEVSSVEYTEDFDSVLTSLAAAGLTHSSC